MMWMVTISDPRCESLRLRLVGCCQYDVTLLSYMPQLYFVCKHLILVFDTLDFFPNCFANCELAEKGFEKQKFFHLCWELNPTPLAYDARTIRPAWQMRMKGVKSFAI